MQNKHEIESFFNKINSSINDFIQLLPVGIIIFDENWKIKSVNEYFGNLVKNEWSSANFEGINLFSKNFLSENIPLQSILELKEKKQFEKSITFTGKSGNKIKLNVKGIPIIKNDHFKGGIIIVDEYTGKHIDNNIEFSSSNTIINVIANICKCFLFLDTHGTIQYISDIKESKCVLFKNPLGKKISDVFVTESDNKIKSKISEIIKTKNQGAINLSYFSENEKISFNSVFLPLKSTKDEVDFILVLLRESDNKNDDAISYLTNENKLKEFKSFATVNSDGLFKINLHGNITYWAESASRLFSVGEDLIINKFIDQLFPEINQKYFENLRKKLLLEGNWSGYFSKLEGETKKVINIKIITHKENSITDFYVYCNLVDEKQQNIILAKEEEKLFFKDTVIKSSQMILQTNPSGTIQFANELFCEKFEFDLDKIRGKYFLDLIAPEFKEKHNISEFELLINNKDFEILPLVAKSGKLIDVSLSINISTTKTDLKYFTIFLNELNKMDKVFLETAHSLLYKYSEAVLIVYKNSIIKVNPKFCELFDTNFETEFIDKNISEIIDQDSLELFKEIINGNPNYKYDETIKFINKNKHIFEANVLKICCAKEATYSVLVIFPIQESENNLIKQEIEKEFRKTDDYFWSGTLHENKLIVDYISPNFLAHIGYPVNYFTDHTDFWEEIIHPNDIDYFNEKIRSFFTDTESKLLKFKIRIIDKKGETLWTNIKVKLKRNNETNKLSFLGFIEDITGITVENELLKERIVDLEKLNSAKEKFISIISHDLKSPFTSIVGFSELILTDSELKKSEIVEYVGHIKEASLHTVDLLNGLLDLTKLQTGRTEVETKIINASYIANKTVEILSGLALQKGITLSSNIDPSYYVNADENLIFQVFNNLVANSIKFTPKGGSIKINANEITSQQKIEFVVEDTGVGIEKEDLEKLFVVDKKFTTLGTDGEKGTGLGLSLVKEIIVKHKGNIKVESEIDKGTKFIFTLPISTPSILIIDGTDPERILYTKLLRSITSSIEILEASNENQGLEIVKEKMPMLIIFEHNLPNMHGYDFVELLRKAQLPYRPSLMLLTKEYNEKLGEIYERLNIDQVFSKPFKLSEFKVWLDKLMGRSK